MAFLGDVDSDDWLTLVKPDLEARMAEYEDGQIEFAILGLVKDPLINLVHSLASNVKSLRALEGRLQDVKPTWRSFATFASSEKDGIPENTVFGPDAHFQLEQAAIERAALGPEVQHKLAGDSVADILDLRRNLAFEQTNLRVAIKEEQASDYHDEARAATRRHDYGPAVKLWIEILSAKGVLRDLLDVG